MTYDTKWITVRCEGGPADKYEYETLSEPTTEIALLRNPFREGEFIRVPIEIPGDLETAFPNAMTYVRTPDAEQSATERVYHPRGETP